MSTGLAFVRLLGVPEAQRDGVPLAPPRGRKGWAVLAVLAVSDRPVSREQLAQVLFADADDPLGALRWTLAELRRALGIPDAFRGDPVRCDVEVDVVALLAGGTEAAAIAETAGRLLESADVPGCPEFETWLVVARHRLVSLAVAHLRDSSMHALALGDLARAVRLAGQAVASDPYDEKLHELLVRCLARAGDAAGARAQAQRAADLLDLSQTSPELLAAASAAPRRPASSVTDAVTSSLLETGQAAVGAGAVDAGIEMLRGAAQQATSESLRARSLLALGTALVHGVRGKDEEGAVVLHEALLLARSAGEREVSVNVLRELVFVDLQAGRTATITERLAEARDLAGEDDGLVAGVLAMQGMHLSDRGDVTESLAVLEESVARARLAGQPRQAAWSQGLAARSLLLLGDALSAVSLASVSIDGCRAERWQAFLPFPLAMRAEAQLADGSFALDEIESDLQTAFALGCQLGDPCWEGAAARGLALVDLRRGLVADARTTIDDAYQRTMRHPDSYVFIEAWVLDAARDIALAAGDQPGAASRGHQLEDLVVRTEQPWFTRRV